jgi:hypothetical protein
MGEDTERRLVGSFADYAEYGKISTKCVINQLGYNVGRSSLLTVHLHFFSAGAFFPLAFGLSVLDFFELGSVEW